ERSAELTPEERHSLARFLAEQEHRGNGVDETNVSPRTNGMALNAAELHAQKREQHMAWLKAHRHEYADQYVALDGDQLMGSGRNIKEADERAKKNGCDQPFLVHVPPSEGGSWGGW